MKNLLLDIPRWKSRIEKSPLALFLDYDGTLSDIAPTPEEAQMPFFTREILKALTGLTDVKVSIISGRPLRDLQQVVGLDEVVLVGSHGLECSDKTWRCGPADVESTALFSEILVELDKLSSLYSGLRVERKPFSVAVHYRQVAVADEKRAVNRIRVICRKAVSSGKYELLLGKKVFELVPAGGMDKGSAVMKLLDLWGMKDPWPVFIGDDITDESAFKALKGKGLTVRVGAARAKSAAEYYLSTTLDVRSFLTLLVYLRQ